jgi:hypothetical protein
MDKVQKEYLEALGRKYLRLDAITPEELRRAQNWIHRSKSQARLFNALAETGDRALQATTFTGELRSAESIERGIPLYNKSGLEELFEDHWLEILTALEPGDLLAEDLDLLRECGFIRPQDEVVLAMRNRAYMTESQNSRRLASASIIAGHSMMSAMKQLDQLATEEATRRDLAQAGSAAAQSKAALTEEQRKAMADCGSAASKKPRKILNGVGKILGGSVLTAGNTLIAIGALPSVAGVGNIAALIASAGAGVSMVMQGAGDLRGE